MCLCAYIHLIGFFYWQNPNNTSSDSQSVVPESADSQASPRQAESQTLGFNKSPASDCSKDLILRPPR